MPIGSVTNGVHARTWITEELDTLLGTEEDMGTPDFARAYDLDDEALWRVQRNARAPARSASPPDGLGPARVVGVSDRRGWLGQDSRPGPAAAGGGSSDP